MSEGVGREIISGSVVGDKHAGFRHRWFGILEVEADHVDRVDGEGRFTYMSGSVAQWFRNGEYVEISGMSGMSGIGEAMSCCLMITSSGSIAKSSVVRSRIGLSV